MSRFERYFLFAAGAILFAFALTIFWSVMAGGTSRILAEKNAILLLTNRWLILLVGASQLFVSAFLLAGRNSLVKSGLVLWLGSILLVAQLGFQGSNVPDVFSSLGSVNPGLMIPPRVLFRLNVVVFSFLWLGGCACFIWEFMTGEKTAGPATAQL